MSWFSGPVAALTLPLRFCSSTFWTYTSCHDRLFHPELYFNFKDILLGPSLAVTVCQGTRHQTHQYYILSPPVITCMCILTAPLLFPHNLYSLLRYCLRHSRSLYPGSFVILHRCMFPYPHSCPCTVSLPFSRSHPTATCLFYVPFVILYMHNYVCAHRSFPLPATL